MRNVTYESLQAKQAWMIVSDQLQQRNNMLAKSISHMERDPKEFADGWSANYASLSP